MGKYSVGFKAGRNLIIVECDNVATINRVIDDSRQNGWEPFFAARGGSMWREPKVENSYDEDLEPSRDEFCPIEGHGDTKKWADTKDGGHYCGHKVNGAWCGYKENEAGQMVKPPKTMPDYVKF